VDAFSDPKQIISDRGPDLPMVMGLRCGLHQITLAFCYYDDAESVKAVKVFCAVMVDCLVIGSSVLFINSCSAQFQYW